MSTGMKEIKCSIYKSQKKDETYVFIPTKKSLSDLPDKLLKILGQADKIMTLTLTAEKKMARGNVKEIMKSIDEQGFYLQMQIKSELDVNPLATSNERFLDKDL